MLRVLAKVIPYATPGDPNLPAFIATERMGQSLNDYDATRSARSHHSCYVGL